MRFKDFSTMINGYVGEKEKETRNTWDEKIRSYKKWSITLIMLLFFVFAVLGMWWWVLGTFIAGHFHVMIHENYQKLRTIERFLEDNK